MTRDEKKSIRLQLIELLDSCDGCQYRYVMNVGVKICPSCAIGQRIQRIGKQLGQDEIFYDGPERRSWTEEEDFYLIHHYGVLPVDRIAKRLGRTTKAVIRRAFVLKKGEMVRA
jgi:hypothetical protein